MDFQFKMNSYLEEAKKAYSISEYKYNEAQTAFKTKQKELDQYKKDIELHTIASTFLQSIIETVCDSNLRKIEEWVNIGLKTIFEDQLVEFKIAKSIKRNLNVYSLVILKDGVEGSVNSYGGGILCVISLILKFLFLAITKSPKILVLDESLSFLSEKYIENCSKFINILVEEFGTTVLLVTHQEKFKDFASTIYEAKPIKKSTVFELYGTN